MTAFMYTYRMAKRQDRTDPEPASPGTDRGSPEGAGRVAQRRRTRAAIVAATTRLIADGQRPSIDDIAAAADVSRRTVYMYFPTLDQLLLDATIGALSARRMEDALIAPQDGDDPVDRVDALVRTITSEAPSTLPLGRKIIQLTVDAAVPPGPEGQPVRGYRRIEWIERAVGSLRDTLTEEQFDRLVSALSLVIGWEAMIILRDLGGLEPEREEKVMRWTARSLVQAMLAEAASDKP
jgi:AcrR family transcriptional regulator